MTYYDLLGVPRDATQEAIRTAFRALARRYHPDAGEGASAERFHQIVQAYEALSDPMRRRAYDLSHVRQRPRMVPVEPLSPRPCRTAAPRRYVEPFEQRYTSDFPPEFRRMDELFDRLMRWFEDDFFFGQSPFRR